MPPPYAPTHSKPQAAAAAIVTPSTRRERQAKRGSPWLLLSRSQEVAAVGTDSRCVAMQGLRSHSA